MTVGNYATCGPVGQAIEQILAANLQVGEVWPPEHAENGFVSAQYPEPGSQVAPGTLVHLFVRGAVEECP